MKQKKQRVNSWIIVVLVSTFLLSLLFSYISNTAITKLDLIPGIIILVLVILVGVFFDLVGVAVTVANEEHFHAQASKKIKGSKTAIKLIRNSAKVSNFCADVIGDICGVLSGAISAIIALKLTESYGMSSYFQFVISALVASFTVGGKAFTKEIAKNKSTEIISFITKIINFDK
ncbi:MAG: hypothetical protein HFJ46_07875 [Clostridia bacterium]|jgi:Mg2+/Co2+ transporter CorB|nr:hypothetical protein [Clostridia bacterium]